MTPIWQQLDALQLRLHRWTMWRGLGWSSAACFGAILLATVADYIFRWNSAAAGWAGLAFVITLTLAVGVWKWIWPCCHRPTSLDIALRIERIDPEWKGRLSAYVALSEDSDRRTFRTAAPESLQALEQALLGQWQMRPESLREDHLLDRSSVLRVWSCLILIVATILSLVCFHPAESIVAFARLLRPWDNVSWPRETQLQVLDENWQPVPAGQRLNVVAGEPLQMFVRDLNSGPPSELKLSIQHGDERRGEVLTPAAVTDAQGNRSEVFTFTFIPDRQPLHFRATAGDDQLMPWFTIVGATPPKIVSATTTIVPPDYSGREAETVKGIPVQISGLPGTRLTIQARADRKLRQARLNTLPPSESTLSLDAQQQQLTAEIVVNAPGRLEYELLLIDTAGLSDPQPVSYEVLAVEDKIPEVTIEIPSSDLLVTPSATIPVRVIARDDVGLAEFSVHLATEDSRLQLEIERQTSTVLTEQRLLSEATIELSGRDLTAGTRVYLKARARDRGLGENREQWSAQRTFTIVTAEELQRDLATRQAALADALAELHNRQSQILQQVKQLRIQQEQAGQLRPQDHESLTSIWERQQGISRSLDPQHKGAAQEAESLVRDYTINPMANSSVMTLLQGIVRELNLVAQGPLSESERLLLDVLNGLETGSTLSISSGTSEASLGDICHELEQTTVVIGQLAATVEEWRQRSDLSDDLNHIITDFRSLQTETISLGQRTVAASVASLTPQDRAELAKLGQRQRELGDRVQSLAGNFQAAAATQPYLVEAAKQLESSRLGPRLVDSALQLERNNMGEVVTTQTRIVEELLLIESLLKGSVANSPEILLKVVADAESTVGAFRGRNAALDRMSQESARQSGSLEGRKILESMNIEQSDLALEVERLARELRLRGIEPPAVALDAAAASMQATGELLDKESPPREEISSGIQEADQSLDQAGNELSNSRRRLELEAATAALWNLAELAEALADRQQGLADEVIRLEQQKSTRGRLSRGESATLQNTAVQQSSLADEVQDLAATTPADTLLHESLLEVVAEMRVVSQGLEQRETGSTISSQQLAIANRLRRIHDAIEESVTASPESSPGNETTAATDSESMQTLAVVAELRLLIREQELLRHQAGAILAGPADDPGRDQAIQSLATRQAHLTEWYRRLLPQFTQQEPQPEK